MDSELIEQIKEMLPYILPIVTAFGAWHKEKIKSLMGRKKEEEEINHSGLDNVQKNLDIYQEMIDDLNARTNQRLKDLENSFKVRITSLNYDLEQLRKLNAQFSKIIEEQKIIISKQNKSLKYYQEKYDVKLKKNNEK